MVNRDGDTWNSKYEGGDDSFLGKIGLRLEESANTCDSSLFIHLKLFPDARPRNYSDNFVKSLSMH